MKRPRWKDWTAGKKGAKLGDKEAIPGTLRLAIQQVVDKKKAWKFKVFMEEGKSRNLAFQSELPVADAQRLLAESPESYLKESNGGGLYVISIHDEGDTERARYTLNVGGPRAKYAKTEIVEYGGFGGGGSVYKVMLEQSNLQNAAMMEMLKTQMSTQSNNFLEAVKLVSELQGGGGSDILSHPLLASLIPTLVNNAFVQKESFFDNVRQALEIGKMMGPQIQPESELGTLVNAVAPLLGTVLAAKMGGGAALPPALAQLASDPAKLQELLSSLGVQPAKSELPQPGQTIQPTTQPNETPKEEDQASSIVVPEPGRGDLPVSPAVDPRLSIVDQMLAQFEKAAGAAGDINFAELAQNFWSMIQYARGLPEPPPQLVPLIVAQNVEDLDLAYRGFVAGSEALGANSQKAEALKITLIAMLVGEHEKHMEAEEAVDAEAIQEEVEPVEPAEILQQDETQDQGEVPPVMIEETETVADAKEADATDEHTRTAGDDRRGTAGSDPPGSGVEVTKDGSESSGEAKEASQAA